MVHIYLGYNYFGSKSDFYKLDTKAHAQLGLAILEEKLGELTNLTLKFRVHYNFNLDISILTMSILKYI